MQTEKNTHLMNERSTLENLLYAQQPLLGSLIRGLRQDTVRWLDFTAANRALDALDLKDTPAFDRWVTDELQGHIGLGGYWEDRIIYRRSEHFDGEEARRLHLGMDIWAPAGTPVYAPWKGKVHSFQDNLGFGNYGPTVILEHTLEKQRFYTLYGHLSRASLKTLEVEQPVEKNDPLAAIGPYPENGDWPPHLHFQVMTDLLGWVGDFPGVAALSEQRHYAEICLDPRCLLRMD